MDALTVNELLAVLKEEIGKGNGSKKILISTDDEGNGYHELFFGVSPAKDALGLYTHLPFNVTKEKAERDYVFLG